MSNITYSIIFNVKDKHLINITCIFPEIVEPFAFIPSSDDKMQVSTVNRERFKKWVKTLESQGCEFEIVN
jgi:hypothetical protein